jgi:hypothetical protein
LEERGFGSASENGAKKNSRKLRVYNRFSRGDVAQMVRAADS